MGHNVSRSTGSLLETKRNNNQENIRCLDCELTSSHLDCGHRFCEKCICAMYNEYIDNTEVVHHEFPCAVCGEMCIKPRSLIGPDEIPRKQSPVDTEPVYEETMKHKDSQFVDDYICKRREDQCKLLWQYKSPCGVGDVTVVNDQSVLYIGLPDDSNNYIKTLHALDERGRSSEVCLPGEFMSPQSIAASKDGRTVTLLDRVDGDENTIYVFRKERRVELWIRIQMIQAYVMQWLDSISPVISDRISTTTFVDNLVTTFSVDGQRLRDHRLCNEVPNIARKSIDSHDDGSLVVSCPTSEHRKGSISFWDKKSDIITAIPSNSEGDDQIDPHGVCFTDNGHVLAADWSSKSVLLFTKGGALIRKVLTLDKEPSAIAVQSDKSLLVAYTDADICMYKL